MFQDVLVEIEGLKMRNVSLAGNVLELSKSHDEQKIENDEALNVNPAVNRQPGFHRETLRASAEWTDKADTAGMCVFL